MSGFNHIRSIKLDDQGQSISRSYHFLFMSPKTSLQLPVRRQTSPNLCVSAANRRLEAWQHLMLLKIKDASLVRWGLRSYVLRLADGTVLTSVQRLRYRCQHQLQHKRTRVGKTDMPVRYLLASCQAAIHRGKLYFSFL